MGVVLGRVAKNVVALFKGEILRIKFTLFKKNHFGRRVRVFRGAELIRTTKAKMSIGDMVRIDSGAIISSVSIGELDIGNNVAVGRNNMIVCHEKITIGDGTILAPNVAIYDHDHTFDSEKGVSHRGYVTAPVKIGNNCWIGANSVILRGTTIGDNCVVGAGSVIKGSYEKGTVVVQKRENVIKEKKCENLHSN